MVHVLVMAVTNTEHAPAAGTALGIVVHEFSWALVIFVATSVLVLAAIHRLAGTKLKICGDTY